MITVFSLQLLFHFQVKVANILDIPVIVTEQYPKGTVVIHAVHCLVLQEITKTGCRTAITDAEQVENNINPLKKGSGCVYC